MESRGRGRARGRARGAQQGQQPAAGGAPGPRPGPPQAQQQAWGARPGGPPPAQAGGAPPHQQTAPQGPWGRPQQQAAPPQAAPPSGQQPVWTRPPAPASVQQQTVGRGSRQGGGDDTGVTTEGKVVQSGGDPGLQDRRGASHGGVRGRTNRNEIISTRPSHISSKKGSDGTVIRLKSNFFPLVKAGGWGLKQYRVDFSPEIDDTRERKKLVRVGLQGHNITGYLFDGTVLNTTVRINPDPLEVFVEQESGEKIRITIRIVGDVAWGDFHYLQLFNIIIRKCLGYMKLELINRNYFDPHAKVTIHEHNLELWPGYFTSMRQHEREILLNVDQTFKVMRTDTVYDLMLECRGQDARQEFQKRVLGSIVLTTYNNKTYRIDDVDFNSTPGSTFSKRDGTQISYAQYFRDRYNQNISQMNQPMLVSRSKPREIRAGMPEVVYLVPSLCTMTGLTDRQRENFHLMKALGEHTRVGPENRMRKLQEFSRRLNGCPEVAQEIQRWDLKLAQTIVELEGRVLPEEMLVGRNASNIPAGPEADWTRHLRSNPMFNAGRLDYLAVITPAKFQQNAQEFTNCVVKAGRGMAFNIPNFKLFTIQDDRSHTYLSMLENVIGKENPSLTMCVLPNNSADRYNAIKKKCYVDRAMPCQVMLAKNLSSKGVMSIATKVAIQMCCKVGGAPWGTTLPPNTMVVGYDVCRDTASRGKSFAGMVASMDKGCSRYFSHTVEHEHEQELSSNIASFLLLACAKYKEINGVFPDRIIIYRDGVGDGQIPYVKEHELDIMKKRLVEEIYKNQPLKMAFIIVSKRINVKIFRASPGGRDRPDYNPPPGTVVDDVITLPERYDFFIVSQCVRQGTVGPTSYNVIEDTLGVDPNRLQRFTYKMCHMYYNWSGTVRVPAPCQYAHKLAFLTAQSLHRSANRGLENLLYYL